MTTEKPRMLEEIVSAARLLMDGPGRTKSDLNAIEAVVREAASRASPEAHGDCEDCESLDRIGKERDDNWRVVLRLRERIREIETLGMPHDVSEALRRMRSQMAYDLARSTFADREALARWVSAYPMGPFAPEEPSAYVRRASPEEGRWRSALMSLGHCPACKSSFRDACTTTPKQRGCAICAPARLLLMGAELTALRSPPAPPLKDPPGDGCGGPQESCIPCRKPSEHEAYRCAECGVTWCDECSCPSTPPVPVDEDPAEDEGRAPGIDAMLMPFHSTCCPGGGWRVEGNTATCRGCLTVCTMTRAPASKEGGR